jgi:hypothetical protein
MTPARLRWGLLLVQIGLLILLVNIDVINNNFVVILASAFPFFLILVGIEKMFTRTRLEVVSYLAVGIIFVGGLFMAVTGSDDAEYGNFFDRTEFSEKADPAIRELQATVRLGDGKLEVRDVTDDLFYGRFAQFVAKPQIKYEADGAIGKIRIQKRGTQFFGDFVKIDIEQDRDDWMLYFSKEVPLNLECIGEDCDVHLNLANTPLKQLTLDADDSQLYVKVGDIEKLVTLSLKGNRSDLRLRLPSGAQIRINADEFESYLEQIGFIKENGFFRSAENGDSLSSEIDIDLDQRLDNVKIEFY